MITWTNHFLLQKFDSCIKNKKYGKIANVAWKFAEGLMVQLSGTVLA